MCGTVSCTRGATVPFASVRVSLLPVHGFHLGSVEDSCNAAMGKPVPSIANR